MPKALENREEKMELAKSLFIQGHKTRSIADKLNMSQATVRTWIARYGWHGTASKIKEETNQMTLGTLHRALTQLSEEAKLTLAEGWLEQIKAIRSKPIRNASELGNKNGSQGEATIVKTITEGAGKTFGWNEEQPKTRLILGDWPEPVDVTAEPLAAEPPLLIANQSH